MEHSGRKVKPLKQKHVKMKLFFRDALNQPSIKRHYYSSKKVLVSPSTKEKNDERTKNYFHGAVN